MYAGISSLSADISSLYAGISSLYLLIFKHYTAVPVTIDPEPTCKPINPVVDQFTYRGLSAKLQCIITGKIIRLMYLYFQSNLHAQQAHGIWGGGGQDGLPPTPAQLFFGILHLHIKMNYHGIHPTFFGSKCM